jgi:hypothetical protein
VAAAVDVFRCVQVGHRIGVIPPDRFQQALESIPVRPIAKLLFIEVGKTGVEGEDLIMVPTALIAQIARRELEIIGKVSLWEASLWRNMVYRRRWVETSAKVTARLIGQKLFPSFFSPLVLLSRFSHVSPTSPLILQVYALPPVALLSQVLRNQ